MKNLLFLFAMLAFLVACSDDDDNDKAPRNKYGQFLVDKIVFSRSAGEYRVFEFTYNSKNELTKIMCPDDESYSIERNGAKLTMTLKEGEDEDVFQVYSTLNENECVVAIEDRREKAIFTYDASNRLISMNAGDYSEQYVWKENNMQSGFDCVFEYTEYPNNINIDFIYLFDEIFAYSSIFCGNFGRPNQNLIKSWTDRWNECEFEYEFDGEKVSVVREYDVRDGKRELEYTYRFYYK